MSAPMLEVAALNAWYGAAQILFDLSFQVGRGEVVALMGRSTVEAFSVYFVEPLTQSYSLQAIAVKATPLANTNATRW